MNEHVRPPRRRPSRMELIIDAVERFIWEVQEISGPDEDKIQLGLTLAATAIENYAAERLKDDFPR